MSSSSAEPTATSNGTAATAAQGAAKAASEQNPALRMMGLPRFRLPSRNWMIFWTFSGSIASAIYYDRWQTKRVKDKWCKLVAPIADEPLDIKSLPRTVTVYLSAPPGDGLRSAREHFHSYIKPVLVAAALNWEVIEGRKEGDVRYKTAQTIRDRRKSTGEQTTDPLAEDVIAVARQNMGVEAFIGAAGDIVVGRHTWKEYLRGLHEGWLGPVDAPVSKEEEAAAQAVTSVDKDAPDNASEPPEDKPEADEDKKPAPEEEKPKPRFPPPYMTPEAFSTASVPRSIPEAFDPVAPISFPHLLGFRNTPIRMYRFINRRRTADEIGRQVATAVLGHSREFRTAVTEDEDSPSTAGKAGYEQSAVLQREERDWWKTVRAPRKEFEESVLIEPVTLNEQVANRMRLFELTSEDEARARKLGAGDRSD